jgi:hypothetical protein
VVEAAGPERCQRLLDRPRRRAELDVAVPVLGDRMLADHLPSLGGVAEKVHVEVDEDRRFLSS